MYKVNLTTMVTTALMLALAEPSKAESASMEKCKINGPDGRSLIKAGMADCAAGGSSCSGSNEDGDPNAWLYLPKGICEKIKGGSLAP